VRQAKTTDPCSAKGLGTGSGSDRGERYGFGPSGGAINDGENVSVALRRWKRANNVNVNVRKTAFRDGNGL